MHVADLVQSRQYLSHIGVWPSARQLELDGWLANYEDGADFDIAAELLDAHVHLNEEHITHAVASTIRSLSALPRFGPATHRRGNWANYLDRVIVSFPLAQDGDPTGSGYIFARLASERLGFPESQVRTPEQLIALLASSSDAFDVLMLDDITASGTQFRRSWNRQTQTLHGRFSLADIAAAGKLSSTYYLPVVATAQAKASIESSCEVDVVPTYLLTPDYGVLDENTRLVRSELRRLVPDFLSRYSPRTGRDKYGNAGYSDLGLAISFHHGCPNNTVPVLQWAPKSTDWTPLVS